MTPPRRPRPSRRLVAGAAIFALTGCAGLFVNPPPKYIFRLTPIGRFPPDLPQTRAQLLVEMPTAPAALDGRRIALTRSAISLDYFADAEWADAVSAMVQTVFANSFENTRAITVINGPLELRADVVLGAEIRHFEAQYGAAGAPPQILVSIGAKLARPPDRAVLAQALFERQVPAAANHLPSIAGAFDAAMQSVTRELVIWTLNEAAMPRHLPGL